MMHKIKNYKRGMTYVELIVVLSIFATMTSVIMVNYRIFQLKVDIKNLASDIALKVVEAQKSSLAGKMPTAAQQTLINSIWKPSYGLYFNLSATTGDNKSFIYFSDIDQSGDFNINDSTCNKNGECMEKVFITKGRYISQLKVFYQNSSTTLNDLTVTFKRPNSSPIIKSTAAFTSNVSYIQITLASLNSITTNINIYPSGRVVIN